MTTSSARPGLRTNEDQIRRIFEVELASYVRAEDLDGYLSLWDEDCMWCPPNRPDRRGKDEIRTGVGDLLAEFAIDPSFRAEEVVVADEYGYVNGTLEAKVRPKGGGPESIVHGREIWLFRLASDGWKIARIIFNDKPN
ncbi:YybH family protein [Actinomadura sp. 9N215]|uniref:YybH family protein n=1 Tax=Actinomadura sp. 9N215 TaxID=3375150 RepID=UPI0037887545